MPSNPRYVATIDHVDGKPHVGLHDTYGVSGPIWLTFSEWVALQIEGNRAMNAVRMAEHGKEVADAK